MLNIKRMIMTVIFAIKHKKKVKKIIAKSNVYNKISNISEIDCRKLKKEGVTVENFCEAT